MTNLYDTNKTRQKRSGRMKLKGYHKIKGTPHKTIKTSCRQITQKFHTFILILQKRFKMII